MALVPEGDRGGAVLNAASLGKGRRRGALKMSQLVSKWDDRLLLCTPFDGTIVAIAFSNGALKYLAQDPPEGYTHVPARGAIGSTGM